MRKAIVRLLLAALNSRILNRTPCGYGFIGNIDAFSYANLASEDKQRPGITVRQVLDEADRFRACQISNGLTVIEPDGASHEATAWDLRDLQRDFDKPREQL
jgi:hypothetical protein